MGVIAYLNRLLLCNQTWQELSRLLGSQLGAKPQGSSLLLRQLASRPQRLEELRNPTVTDLVQLLSVRSEGTRSLPSCSSASCPSSVLSVKLLRTSRRTSGSKAPLSWLSRRLARPTSLGSSRIPTSVPSTPRG